MNNNRLHLIVIMALFLGIVAIRLSNLAGDTPFGISTGQELSTDPPQYTSFARNKVLFGAAEIFYTRYVFFVNNLTTWAAYPVFRLLGTGRAQSNLVAVLFCLLAIFACFMAWRQKGYAISIAATAILGFNYIFASYGKMTFLEVTTVSAVSIGGFFLLWERKRNLSALLSGVCLAAAAFYSKLLGIVFLPLAILILVIELYQVYRPGIFKKINPLYSFLAGYGFIFLLWLMFVYLPSRGEVSGYISEISTGMYGAPKAFESIKMFFVQLFSYGFDIKLWSKQPITFATGLLGAAVVGGQILSQTKGFVKKLDRVDLFFLLWFLGIYTFLFPWNYRPLRYTLVIFPPLCYLSARWIILLIESSGEWGKRTWPFHVLTFAGGSLLTFHLLIARHFDERGLDLILKYIPIGLVGGAIILGSSFLIQKTGLKKKLTSPGIWSGGGIIASCLIIAIVAIQLSLYFSNSYKDQRTISIASKDLGNILAPDAVVIGSYSSALTQDNHLRSVIKMFGVPVVEKDFFNKVPATHVSIEAGGGEGSNESRAMKDYPEIMKNAPVVTTYYLRGYPINVYLISRTSPNPQARSYQPTLYEQAAINLQEGKIDSAQAKLAIFERGNPNTISGETLRMKIALALNDSKGELDCLQNIVKADSGNLNYWWMLGDAAVKLKPPDLSLAFNAYRKALYLRPGDKILGRQLELLGQYMK
jgi:hypothetical protein